MDEKPDMHTRLNVVEHFVEEIHDAAVELRGLVDTNQRDAAIRKAFTIAKDAGELRGSLLDLSQTLSASHE